MPLSKLTKPRPSYKQGFGIRQGSTVPDLWKGNIIAIAPALGITGNTIRDQGQLKRHGTLNNATWVFTADGPVLNFPVSGTAFVDLGTKTIVPSGPFTINIWVYLLNNTNNNFVFSQDQGSNTQRRFALSFIEAGGAGGSPEGYKWNVNDDGDAQFEGTIDGIGTIALNEWHMITVTFDGVTYRVYWDINLEGTAVAGAINPTTSNLPNYIGARTGPSGHFEGRTSTLAVWNRNLNIQEVEPIFSNHLAMFESRPDIVSIPIELLELAAMSKMIGLEPVQSYGIGTN